MSDKALAGAIFLLLLFAYAYVNQPAGWNQLSRFDLLYAIVEEGRLTIDSYHHNTSDKALIDGHYYSEKAPGTAFIALPSFAMTYAAFSLFDSDIHEESIATALRWIVTAGSVGIIAALGGVAFFLLLTHFIGRRFAFIATFAVFLGALPYPYATALFSHAAVFGLIIGALWLLLQPSHRDFSAGLLCGLAIASEYPSAVVVGGLAIFLFLHDRQRTLRFIVGIIPLALLIPAYNMAVSGSPFALGYESVGAEFAGMQRGFFGITLPNLTNAFTLLFSEYRGLFFWSPFLLLAFPGYFVLWRSRRDLFWLTSVVPLIHLLMISGYEYWYGGWALGPRHLTPAIPLIALAAAFGLQKFPRTGTALAIISILLTGGATFIYATPPQEILHPLRNFYTVALEEGAFVHNLGTAVGLSHFFSVFPLLLIVGLSAFCILRVLRD